jgi:hypothetical protein
VTPHAFNNWRLETGKNENKENPKSRYVWMFMPNAWINAR